MFTTRTVSVFALAFVLASCSDDPAAPVDAGNDTGSGDGGSALALTPVDGLAIIDLSANVGATLTYKVTATDANGTRDVSSTASLALADPKLGGFAGPVLTTAVALPGAAALAKTTVKASAAGANTSGSLVLGAYRKTGAQRDLLFTAAAGSLAPKQEVLKVGSTPNQADILFLVDSSAGTASAMAALQGALATVVTQLGKTIPGLALGVAENRDYPEAPFGASGDFPVKITQTIDADPSKATTALNALVASGGGDSLTSQLPAMQYALTGAALTWPSGSLPAHAAPSGRLGGADFRTDSAKIVIGVYGSNWHDSALGPYSFPAPTLGDVKASFAKTSAKFMGIGIGFTSESQADNLSDASKSNIPAPAFGVTCGGLCCTGVNGVGRAANGPGGTCRGNFLTAGDGTGLSSSFAKAVQAMVVGSQLDVTYALTNDPANGGFDATKLVVVKALDQGDAPNGCPAQAAKDTGSGVLDTFVSVIPGTPLCFGFTTNDAALPAATAAPQVFAVDFQVVGKPSNIVLERRTLLFVIPAKP